MKLAKKLLYLSLLLVLIACGSDDDSDTNITIAQPEEDVQREEGQAPVGQTVIINRFDPAIKVNNKNIVVDDDTNVATVRFEVQDAAPVTHQHNVYVSNSCDVIINNDANNDSIIDLQEVEQAVGTPVVTLNEAQGSNYLFTSQMQLSQLPPVDENFILVLYGAQGVNIPVACFPFIINIDRDDDRGPTGGTTGGATGGTAGGTTGTP
jgi:hypothetical protein